MAHRGEERDQILKAYLDTQGIEINSLAEVSMKCIIATVPLSYSNSFPATINLSEYVPQLSYVDAIKDMQITVLCTAIINKSSKLEKVIARNFVPIFCMVLSEKKIPTFKNILYRLNTDSELAEAYRIESQRYIESA